MNRGDKYIIEVNEVHSHQDDLGQSYRLGRVKGFSSLVFDNNGLSKLTPLDEHDKVIRRQVVERITGALSVSNILTDKQMVEVSSIIASVLDVSERL